MSFSILWNDFPATVPPVWGRFQDPDPGSLLDGFLVDKDSKEPVNLDTRPLVPKTLGAAGRQNTKNMQVISATAHKVRADIE